MNPDLTGYNLSIRVDLRRRTFAKHTNTPGKINKFLLNIHDSCFHTDNVNFKVIGSFIFHSYVHRKNEIYSQQNCSA